MAKIAPKKPQLTQVQETALVQWPELPNEVRAAIKLLVESSDWKHLDFSLRIHEAKDLKCIGHLDQCILRFVQVAGIETFVYTMMGVIGDNLLQRTECIGWCALVVSMKGIRGQPMSNYGFRNRLQIVLIASLATPS